MIDEGLRIELPLLDYSKRRDSKVTECFLTLDKNFMYYKIIASYEQLDDDTSIWVPKKVNYRWCRPKANLSEVSMYFDNPESLYSVGIEFSGVSDGNNWLFTTGKDALVIYNQLMEYMTR